jgi:hypothetical protein
LAVPAKTLEARRKSDSLLTINGGSSSIRFALFDVGEPLRRPIAQTICVPTLCTDGGPENPYVSKGPLNSGCFRGGGGEGGIRTPMLKMADK